MPNASRLRTALGLASIKICHEMGARRFDMDGGSDGDDATAQEALLVLAVQYHEFQTEFLCLTKRLTDGVLGRAFFGAALFPFGPALTQPLQ